jgi:hypothetical protein
MMHDRAWRALGAASLYSLSIVCAGFVACAGGETPATDAELRAQITDIYVEGNGAVGRAGNSGGGGRSGAGGSAQAEAGAAGDDGGRGGSSGGSGGECDGFAVLQTNCGGSGCHGQDSLYSNFAESEEAALAFVGESGEATCANAGPMIDPANPAASIILQKVTASSPPCGERMPVVGGPLSQEDVTCLQEWIGSL